MAKTIIFIFMSLAFFGCSQSAVVDCQFKTGNWAIPLGSLYFCNVQNAVRITSPDAAQVDSISGTHLPCYNNDNVEAISASQRQIHYFPRELNKFFKNLKGIMFTSTGLKEIHQSDLKDLPKLVNLYLWSNNLEILEDNLFEFNPNLELIYLNSNKISHIDPNVFDNLTKLKYLWLNGNSCISLDANNNSTALQNIIKTSKSQCKNSEYFNLEQKVKNLEIESKNLNSENLKGKLEKLENEIKSSKFSNYFQEKLKDLKTVQDIRQTEESTTPKPTTTTTTATTEAPKKSEMIKVETCSAMESKIDEIAVKLNYCVDQVVNGTNSNKIDNNHQQNEQCAAIKEDLRNQTEAIDTRLEILEENVENFKMVAPREIQNIKNAVKDAHHGLMMSMNVKADKIEKKIKKIEEENRKFEEKLTIIMKALKIDD